MPGRHRKLPPTRHRQHGGRHRKPPSRQLSVLPTVAAAALLAVGGVGLGHAVARDPARGSAMPAITATASSPAAIPTPAVTAPVSSPGPRQPKPAHRPRHHHRPPAALTVTDLGPASYLQVTTAHGRLLVRRILHGHQQLTFRRHGLHVVLGNAGGVRIAVNGHRGHRAGRSGQVLRFGVH